jgi:hypothetical protein
LVHGLRVPAGRVEKGARGEDFAGEQIKKRSLSFAPIGKNEALREMPMYCVPAGARLVGLNLLLLDFSLAAFKAGDTAPDNFLVGVHGDVAKRLLIDSYQAPGDGQEINAGQIADTGDKRNTFMGMNALAMPKNVFNVSDRLDLANLYAWDAPIGNSLNCLVHFF